MKHNNIAIFIPHIGCPNQCSFCNQNTISGSMTAPTVSDVYETLRKADKVIADKSNTQVAFFGGSFTAINREYMLSLLSVCSEFNFSGIRISTRPDCIDQEILDILKANNVTAIELGAQSMDNNVLKLNNRGHYSDDVIKASKLIKENGFSLGLQMMVSLYGDTVDGAVKTCKEIISLQPDTVRIYPTVILKGTELESLYNSGKYKVIQLEEAVKVCAEILWLFEQNGIKVIKLGLHASSDVENEMVGGIYHPAFRELCEGNLFYQIAIDLLENSSDKDVILYVNSSCVSKLIGQSKVNIKAFSRLGYNVKVVADNTLSGFQLRIEKDGKHCY